MIIFKLDDFVDKSGSFLSQEKEMNIAIVKLNGYVLQYIKEQTEIICIDAVKRNCWELQYVNEQTDEICIEAVKQME